MKNQILKISAAFLCVAALASCNKNNSSILPEISGETSTLSIKFDFPDGITKDSSSEAYTTELAAEKKINNVEVLVFRKTTSADNGQLEAYRSLTSSEMENVKFNLPIGRKDVLVFINTDMSAVKTRSEAEAMIQKLPSSMDKGFVMYGVGNANLMSQGYELSVAVSRMVSRIALCSIKNELPSAMGAITLKKVYLANVVEGEDVKKTLSTLVWADQDEFPHLTLKSGADQSITASAPFSPEVPFLFYTMANPKTNHLTLDPEEDTDGAATYLIVETQIASKTYYYTVALDKAAMEFNTTYSVNLTVKSLGSLVPLEIVDKANLDVTITVNGWQTGSIYNVII